MLITHFLYAIARKESETGEIYRIDFPEVDGLSFISNELSDSEEEKLKSKGFVNFLSEDYMQARVKAALDELDEYNEAITQLDAAEIREKANIGPYDRLERVCVEFQSKHRSNLCHRFLSPVMKTTLLVELILFIPIISTAIGMSEMELLDADKEAAKISGSGLGMLFALYNLVSIFAGPGANNLSVFGSHFDKAFYSIWDVLTCKKSRPKPNEKKENKCSLRNAKIIGAKAGVTSAFLAFLYSDLMLNFQQFASMEAQIAAMAPYSIFHEKLITHCMKINFMLNQVNDPIYASSLLAWFYKRINQYFPPSRSEHKEDEREQKRESLSETLLEQSDMIEPNYASLVNDEEPTKSSCWSRFFSRKAYNPRVMINNTTRDSLSSNRI